MGYQKTIQDSLGVNLTAIIRKILRDLGVTGGSSNPTAAETFQNKSISGSNNILSNIPQTAITNLTSDLLGKSNVGHSQAASTITGLAAVATSGVYSDLTAKPTIPTLVSALTNDSGYQTAAQVSTATGVVTAALTKVTVSNAYTGSTTAQLSDAGSNVLVTLTASSANNFTIPPNSSVAFPVGSVITVASLGAGQTSLVAGAGVTLSSPGNLLKVRTQYSSVSLIQLTTNNWLVTGDLSA